MAGASNASGGTNTGGANAAGAANTGGTGNTAAVAGTSGSGASAGELGGETLSLCGDNELLRATPPTDVALRVVATYDGRPIDIRDFDDPLRLPAINFTIAGAELTEVYFAFSFDDLGGKGNVGVTSNGNDTCSTYAAVWPGGGSDYGASTLETTTFGAGAPNPVTIGAMHLELPASDPIDTTRLHLLDATFSLPAQIVKVPVR